MHEVFDRFTKADLAINLSNSEFFASKLEFLGPINDADSIRPSPKHMAAVQDYPTPPSKEDISRFLGLLNFFRSFLPNAALLLQPLTSLMKKREVFVWEKSQQDAFQQAKQALLYAVILQHLSPTAQVQLNTDASGTQVRAALMQRENGQQPWFPVTFYSKGLNSSQKKYSTYDCELLATFLACKKFRHFLKGRKFQLKTDHQSLVPSLLRKKTSDSDKQQQQLSYFFRSFLPNAALLLQPLTSLMMKSAVFVWEKSQQDTFKQAKQALMQH